MKTRTIINKNINSSLRTTEPFEGESLEDKVKRVTKSGAPIEAISNNQVYTERKDGVLKETNIRTDKFEVAMEAMQSIAEGKRQKLDTADKPDANSEINVTD